MCQDTEHKQQMQGLYQEIKKIEWGTDDLHHNNMVEYMRGLVLWFAAYEPVPYQEDPIILGITHTFKNGNS